MKGITEIGEMGIGALNAAHKIIRGLGEKGFFQKVTNEFGKEALLADWESEEAVVSYLNESDLKMEVIAEEHSVIVLDGDSEIFTVVLDGLDGSSVYQKTRGQGRFGTILGVFRGADPFYSDIVFSGIIDHSTGEIYFADSGKQSRIFKDGNTTPIQCSGTTELTKHTRIYIDSWFETNITTFQKGLPGYSMKCLDCSAIYYMDLACGRADAVFECTRKKNLEIAGASGLIKKAGGVMATLSGEDLGGKKYFKFGQNEEYIHVISAATQELLDDVLAHLNKK